MDEQFLERMDSQLAGWSDPVERLRRALENDEFELYCQPFLALQAGGYPLGEVLVRLHEEERALVPRGEFLPVFEHFRMMPQLDRWVVRPYREAPRGRLAHRLLHDQPVGPDAGGEAFGYSVVAECVEEQDMLLHLKASGVGYAQGFGIHQPQPIDALAHPA